MTLTEQFEALTLDDINAYLTERREENLSLEFKTINTPELNRLDRRNLAIAISGFANSSGGLVVWGIVARENTDRIDCASGTQEIDLSHNLYQNLMNIPAVPPPQLLKACSTKLFLSPMIEDTP